MHDSRQRRKAARGIGVRALVRNVVMLIVAVTVAVLLIPTVDAEEEPGGAIQSVVRADH